MGKEFMDYFRSSDADVFCIQETKMQQGEDVFAEGYREFWNEADKKGYSGTAVFSRTEPVNVYFGLGDEDEDNEGRVITLEFEHFFVVNAYVPNAGEGLKRLDFRLEWDKRFREYLMSLDKQKPLIAVGDFNVAHKAADIKNASSNRRHAGFTDEERESFSQLLGAGFLDAFRVLYPDAKDAYTYWSFFSNARQRNTGWRIDYGCISERVKSDLKDVILRSDVFGSDHCPVELDIF
jgi:exodeoxyribonuclease-3